MIYLFPGIGASEKLFAPFSFSPYEAKVISFLPPEKNESLNHYCRRLAAPINKREANIYIGVSFGGILAQEIAKEIPPEKIILISSIKSKHENPWYFPLVDRFPVHQIIPASLLKTILVFMSEIVSHKTADEEQRFRILVKEADDMVIKWGITKVIRWDQDSPPQNIYHIHGDKDIVFPIKKIKVDYVVRNGTHFMIMRDIKEINTLIMSLLKKESVQNV